MIGRKHNVFSARPAVTEAIEIPQFIGRSYLTYDNRDILKRSVLEKYILAS